MKQKTAKTYALYLRCSNDDQSQDYTAIDTQREINTKYVQEHGGILVGEYSDKEKLLRPGLQCLLNDAKARKFDVVVCTDMSRLARGMKFSILEHLLSEEQAEVEIAQEYFQHCDARSFGGKEE